jgi:hypothetical protein
MQTLRLILPALTGFTLFLVLHLLAWQWLASKRKGVVALVTISAASYALATVIAAMWFSLPPLVHVWTSMPFHAFLTVFYMHLYFGVDRSLSVRILGELSKAPGTVVSFSDLDAFYPKRDMIERRVQVLVEKGLLRMGDDGAYTCTPGGRFLARLAMLGKRLYNLDATG